MKKVFSLIAVLMITAISFGQASVKFTDAKAGYDKTATTSFNFLFGPDIKSEDIKNTATYYESYFSVDVTNAEAGNNVKITLVEDNDMSRRVILRLFVSLEVKKIEANGEQLDKNDFMTKYIWFD